MGIAFIGIGRLGGALASALANSGHKIDFLVSREAAKPNEATELFDSSTRLLTTEELEKITSEIIFITVPDPQITAVARRLAGKLNHKPAVFHTSGALSSDVLESLRAAGCSVGSLHPLISVSDARRGAASFKNAYFCIEGDADASLMAEKMVADLGGKSFSVETRLKPLYHASAVTAAGHFTALFSVAIEMFAACGVPAEQAQKILIPLVESTIKNFASQTPAQALTGTFARADAETLRLHLEILETSVSPQATVIYKLLGLRSLELAGAQGADPERLEEMREMLIEKND